jgi:hypothetical protein
MALVMLIDGQRDESRLFVHAQALSSSARTTLAGGSLPTPPGAGALTTTGSAAEGRIFSPPGAAASAPKRVDMWGFSFCEGRFRLELVSQSRHRDRPERAASADGRTGSNGLALTLKTIDLFPPEAVAGAANLVDGGGRA